MTNVHAATILHQSPLPCQAQVLGTGETLHYGCKPRCESVKTTDVSSVTGKEKAMQNGG